MAEVIAKKSPIFGISYAAIGVAAATAVFAVVSARSPQASLARATSDANLYLSELSFEQAIASYQEALAIDPMNTEALEGLMQAAFESGNLELLEQTFTAYQAAVGADSESAVQMAEQIRELRKESDLAEATSLVEAGDYAGADEILARLAADHPDEDLLRLHISLLEKLAESAWQRREFEAAMDYLKQAYELAGDDAQVKDDLLRVAESYVIDCKNSQNYDTALELIDWIQQVRGDASLEEYRTQITEMQAVDAALQELIEELNAAFDADDIDQITSLMQSDAFKENGKQIRTVLYSSSLRASAVPEGQGTAIYNVYGTLYVYYGTYAHGVREGHGLWYYSDGEGRLKKYDLQWSGDLPNGEGTLDDYGKLFNHDYGGNVIGENVTHNIGRFHTQNGVMTGEYHRHSDVLDDYYSYSYDFEIMLTDGYAPKIEVGEYPEEIAWYHAYPVPLVAWTDAMIDYGGDGFWGYDSVTIWWDWWPGQWTVDGVSTRSASASAQDIAIQ